MVTFDPVGIHRLSFMQGQNQLQQYRLVLSVFGCQRHGKYDEPNLETLQQRIYGIVRFVETLNDIYGAVIKPLELRQEHFVEVVHAWHTSNIDKKKFALRAKVAAWLNDLCVDHDHTPYA